MANCYTQFSELFETLKPESVDWIKEFLKGPDEDAMSPEEFEQFHKERNISTDCYWPDFEWAFQEGAILWVSDKDGGGDIDHVVALLQAYLKKFDPKGSFGISWSGTCSKPRPGEFGGGAIFVTAKKVEWMTTWDWLQKKKAKKKAVKPKPAKKAPK
jgi:hypothetical protein